MVEAAYKKTSSLEKKLRVLVVHDRREVSGRILEIVQTLCTDLEIELVEDAANARNRLASNFYDLLILDLTIPNVLGGEPGLEVVENLLEELMNSGTLMVPGGVLGITQDVSALDTVQNDIGPHLMAVVSEDVDNHWEKQLSDRVQYAFKSVGARANSLLTKHDFDMLIMTALDKELSPYKTMFDLSDHPTIAGLKQFAFTDRQGRLRRGACYAIGRAGQPSAASETQGLLCQLRPKLAIMTGFCGGVPGKLELGEIAFAGLALDWDYGKWKPFEKISKLYSRPEPIVIRNSQAHRIARGIVEDGFDDSEPLDALLALHSKGEITRAKFAMVPFASGSAVIGDANVLSSIQNLNEGIGGVDMESFGFYFACDHAHAAAPEYICIKAAADDCSPKKDDRLHKACCIATAHVAKAIATTLWDF